VAVGGGHGEVCEGPARVMDGESRRKWGGREDGDSGKTRPVAW
jgi:hypothetical protein